VTKLSLRAAGRYAGRVDGTVPIARFFSEQGAGEAAAVLREHGLLCAVVETPGSSVWPSLVSADGGHRWLVVDAADADRARALIADLPHDEP
jgi:hypothetical protein